MRRVQVLPCGEKYDADKGESIRVLKSRPYLTSSLPHPGRGHYCDLDHLHFSDIHALPDVPGPVAEQASEGELPGAHQRRCT